MTAAADPRVVAAAVVAVPGVVRLEAGRFGEVSSFLPGERVLGVRVSPERAEVHVVIGASANAVEVADAVRVAVVAALGEAVPVDVHIDDIDLEHEDDEPRALPAADETATGLPLAGAPAIPL